MTVDGTLLSVCLVCGGLGEKTMTTLSSSVVTAISRDSLPSRGEPIIRGMEAPFDGALYALTLAWEFAGNLEPFRGKVGVSLPLELAEAFKLVRVDVTAATETTPRSETWTDIPFTFENGTLTFQTDAEGLFLLIPAA